MQNTVALLVIKADAIIVVQYAQDMLKVEDYKSNGVILSLYFCLQ